MDTDKTTADNTMIPTGFRTLNTCRSTIEYQGCIIVKQTGEVIDTEYIMKQSIPELAESIAKLLKQISRTQKITFEHGKNIKFERIEGIIRKAYPSDCNLDTDLLQNILWHAGIL